MSIPFDNLYHWVESHYPSLGITYTFTPPGSRELQNLNFFRDYSRYEQELYPEIICHDQEPLNFNLYKSLDPDLLNLLQGADDQPTEIVQNLNIRAALSKTSIYDKVILVHSEKNSKDLELYKNNGFIDVHYWAHAIIARDWFRFALHDKRLSYPSTVQDKKKFLVYLREWDGTREYRLMFAKMVVDSGLLPACTISIKRFSESGKLPDQHIFKNYELSLNNFDFVNKLDDNIFSSAASADYNYIDIINNCISVVLETVFDGNKIHLTEKILRPIACGHPFILAAGPGSLDYIRSYGFKTFSPWINEEYDNEYNSVKRLQLIINEMVRISNLNGKELNTLLDELYKISSFNKQHFFSNDFMSQISNELTQNFKLAFDQVNITKGSMFINRLKPKVYNDNDRRRKKILKLRALRQKSQ